MTHRHPSLSSSVPTDSIHSKGSSSPEEFELTEFVLLLLCGKSLEADFRSVTLEELYDSTPPLWRAWVVCFEFLERPYLAFEPVTLFLADWHGQIMTCVL
jgi:hypothetical protein